jgi:hypothetical protein
VQIVDDDGMGVMGTVVRQMRVIRRQVRVVVRQDGLVIGRP